MMHPTKLIQQKLVDHPMILSLLLMAKLLALPSVSADSLGDSLAGQLDKKADTEGAKGEEPTHGVPKFRTRGAPKQPTRGTTKQPTVQTEYQTIYTSREVAKEMIRSRGVPANIEIEDEAAVQEALQSDGAIQLKTTKLGTSETEEKVGAGDLPAGLGEEVVAIEIKVDPASKTAGQINFVKNKAIIKDDSSFVFLAELVEALTNDDRLKDQRFVIQGHASADGDVHHNLELSQKRADAIFTELVRRGVESKRIFALGVGEQFARHGEDEPERLRALDRRVILYRLQK